MPNFRPVRLGALGNGTGVRVEAVPAGRVVEAPPLRIGARMLDALGMEDPWRGHGNGELPPYGSTVAELAGAGVLSGGGIVFLPGGEVVADTLDHTVGVLDGYRTGPDGGVEIAAPGETLRGRHLSLLIGGHGNHFHWLVMGLARMALPAPERLRGLHGILVPAELKPGQREVLLASGVAELAPMREVRQREVLAVEELLLPWNLAGGGGINPLGSDWLRRLGEKAGAAVDAAGGAGRRIYIDRRGSPTRVLQNEDEVVALLEARDFRSVRFEGMGFGEQVRTVRNAELVVGPHGAGLANIAFARPGTTVIELMPSAMPNWCYRHMAAAGGLRYDCVLGRSRGGESWSPWVVSPTHVLSALAEVGA